MRANSRSALGEKVSRLWNRTWYEGQSSFDLGVARALGCLLILAFALPPLHLTLALDLKSGAAVTPRPALSLVAFILGDVVTTTGFWLFVHWSTVMAGALAVLGWRSRFSVPAFAFGFLLLVSHMWSFGELHHPRIAPIWFLLLLALSPCGRRFSLDAVRRKKDRSVQPEGGSDCSGSAWVGNLFFAMIAYAYSYSGLWKVLVQGGAEWMNGLTARFYLFVPDIEKMCSQDRSGSYYVLYDSLLLLKLSSVGTIIFEVLFPLGLFVRQLRWPFVGAAFLFHLGNYGLRGENGIFLLYPVLAGLLLCSFEVRPSGRLTS